MRLLIGDRVSEDVCKAEILDGLKLGSLESKADSADRLAFITTFTKVTGLE